jgi:hypothetical protein
VTTTETTPIPDAPADLGDSARFWPIWWQTSVWKGKSLSPAERAKLVHETCLAFDLTQARETPEAERRAAWDRYNTAGQKLGLFEMVTFPAIR